MFQIDTSWEALSSSQVLRALFGTVNLKQYSVVEIKNNVCLFHVDVLFAGEGVELGLWERFVCADLVSTADLIQQELVREVAVHVQTPFSRDKPYQLLRVVEFNRIFDDQQNYGYSCLCDNGFRIQQFRSIEVDPNLVQTSSLFP